MSGMAGGLRSTDPAIAGCRCRHPGVMVAAVAGWALAAAGLSGCGQTSQTATAPTASQPVSAPLATSIGAAGGTWATMPMGHLDQPLNTFWQLFYRPVGSSSWSDQVEATATATNGGLVLAGREGGSLVVGVRPSNQLHFSPLVATSDGGRSWSNGLTGALVARPSALAVGPNGDSLAIVSGPGGPQALMSRSGLSDWTVLASLPAIGSSPAGQSCDPATIDAVGYAGDNAVVGAPCARRGVVGLFARKSGTWQLVGPAPVPSLAQDTIDVLGLRSTTGGVSALLAASDPAGTSLVATWSADGGVNWVASPALQLAAGEQLSSFGPATGEGLFVLTSDPSGLKRLDVLGGPGSSWEQLPSPPPGTATVAFGPSPTAQALVATGTILTVWTLATASSPWTKGQVINVPIQFGSSS